MCSGDIPESKNLYSNASIMFSPCRILLQRMNENKSLCRSNSDLKMFVYTENVEKKRFRFSTL